MRRILSLASVLLVEILVSGMPLGGPAQDSDTNGPVEDESVERYVPPGFQRAFPPRHDASWDPGQFAFEVDVKRDVYLLGEPVTVRWWFTNLGPDPVPLGPGCNGGIAELHIFSESGEHVYNGTNRVCLAVFQMPILVEPGATLIGEGDLAMRYRVTEYGPKGYAVSRTDELLPPGNYLVALGLVGPPCVDADWVTIVKPRIEA